MTDNIKETSDHYPHIVADIGRYRVIVCRDDIQWIIQRRHSDRWRSESYFCTKSALIREWSKLAANSGEVPVELVNLPDRFKDRLPLRDTVSAP